MAIPTMPSTHTWVQLGPGLSKAGRNALFAADGADVWVWDDDPNPPVPDLLDADGNPTTLAVKDGWAGTGDPAGVGVPVGARVLSFSIGQSGKRVATLPVQTLRDAASALAPTDSQVAALLGNSSSATRTQGDTVYAPALVGGKAPVRKGDLVLNVKDYGAVGDGTTDDRASIQSAIDAAAANTGLGGTVYFPPGAYRIAGSLNVNTNEVKLVGSGGNGSQIRIDFDGDGIVFAAAVNRCIMRDLWIGSFSTRTSGWAVKINGSSGSQSAYVDFQNITIQNTYGGITASWLNQSTWTNLRFIRSAAWGFTAQPIYMVGVKSHRLAQFVMTSTSGNFGSEGIRLDSECDTILISDGEIINAGGVAGMYLLNSLGGSNTGPRLVSVARVLVETATGVGFYIGAGRFAKLTQCWASANAQQGFILAGHDGANLSDCEATQNGTAGFQVASGSGPYSLTSCNANYNSQSANNTYAGIQIDPNVTHVRIIGGRLGNWLYSFTNKQVYGVNINATGTDYIVVQGVDAQGHAGTAINNASAGTHNSITGNVS